MPTRDEALKIAEYIGCSGVHRSEQNNWMPCSSAEELRRASAEAEPTKKVVPQEFAISNRKNRRGKRKFVGKNFEKLRESGVSGITSIPNVGLVSAKPGDVGSL